jgi:RNA polymerase sigma-70 factor, ECF subfamily
MGSADNGADAGGAGRARRACATAAAEPAADELALAQHAAHGDHHAFAQIVRAYESRLIAYLAQLLGDADLARDLAQETFIAAYQALPRWTPPAPAASGATAAPAHPLSPWLYRIATNRALSLLRARPRAAAPPAHPATRASEPISTGFEERYIARELLTAALRTLPEDDAACLVLHFVSGERYGEIAARLGLSAEAVRKRVSRGLAALRAAYTALDTLDSEVRA